MAIVDRVAAAARAAVTRLFLKTSVRMGLMTGPKGEKRVYVQVDPRTTIPGLYEASVRAHGGTPKLTQAATVRKIAGTYLESQKEAALAAVTRTVHGIFGGFAESPNPADVRDALKTSLTRIMDKLQPAIERIANTEATAARNLGGVEAIRQMAKSAGTDDPLVYFVIIRDGEACDECQDLHMLDAITPKVWKLSECESGYHERGSGRPSQLGEHPHCRCTMVYLAPGWGFNASGFAAPMPVGHDEYAKQRS